MEKFDLSRFAALAMAAGTIVLTISIASSAELETVARSAKFAMNGVAVTKAGRIFVSIPQWTKHKSPSVAEIRNGKIVPYPGNDWNRFDLAHAKDRFVNVNAVHSDGAGSLWAVDYAAPNFGHVVDGAQKLVRIDLATNKVARVYRFDKSVLPKGAKLNDVRVDVERGIAYISEFGVGAIIVLDIDTGKAFRALDRHYSVRAHPDVRTTFLGKSFRTHFLQVNDIELARDGQTLFYQPTGGRVLWKIATNKLIESASNAELEPHVLIAGKSMTIGGITRDASDRLYLGSVQDNAIWLLDPVTQKSHKLFEDARLLWPDAMSIHDSDLYIPAPQLKLLPKFNGGSDRTRGDFSVYRVKLKSTFP